MGRHSRTRNCPNFERFNSINSHGHIDIMPSLTGSIYWDKEAVRELDLWGMGGNLGFPNVYQHTTHFKGYDIHLWPECVCQRPLLTALVCGTSLNTVHQECPTATALRQQCDMITLLSLSLSLPKHRQEKQETINLNRHHRSICFYLQDSTIWQYSQAHRRCPFPIKAQ